MRTLMGEFIRIIRDPHVMEGRVCIWGMGVTVGLIFGQSVWDAP